jgi:hypothetical protein
MWLYDKYYREAPNNLSIVGKRIKCVPNDIDLLLTSKSVSVWLRDDVTNYNNS